jgi:hypothetical protein
VDDPLLESDFEYRRYINTIKMNFTPKCVEMLDSVDQVHGVLKLSNQKYERIKSRIAELEDEQIQKDVPKKKEERILNKLKDLEKIWSHFINLVPSHSINGHKPEGEYTIICRKIVDELIYGEAHKNEMGELKTETAQTIKDILQTEGILYLTSLTGC